MKCVIFCSIAAVTLFAVVLARADDSNKQRDHDHKQVKATIAKVDLKKSTMTVTMKDEDGKEVERTFQLTGRAPSTSTAMARPPSSMPSNRETMS